MLRCRSCTATFAFLQCGSHFSQKLRCSKRKLHCNIEKAALQESGAFLPLSCGFQAPTFRHPRLGVYIVFLVFPGRESNEMLSRFTSGKFKQGVSKRGATIFTWRLGCQYDVAATQHAHTVLASDCRVQFGRASTRRGCCIW